MIDNEHINSYKDFKNKTYFVVVHNYGHASRNKFFENDLTTFQPAQSNNEYLIDGNSYVWNKTITYYHYSNLYLVY